MQACRQVCSLKKKCYNKVRLNVELISYRNRQITEAKRDIHEADVILIGPKFVMSCLQ